MKKTLILDDDKRFAHSLASEFTDHGYEVTIANTLEQVPHHSFDYAVVDLRLTGEFGTDALAKIKGASPNCRIIILSGYGTINAAVEALKRGAVDFLTKPASFIEIETALLGDKNEVFSTHIKPQTLSEAESNYIEYMLQKNEGNISKTAKDLGIHRQSLQRKLKKFT